MPKNGQNDLKFGHNMYYDHFYLFFKFCQNSSKNGDFLAKKLPFFRFYVAISVIQFPTENMSSPRKMVQLS